MALAPRTRKKYIAAGTEFLEFRKIMQLDHTWPAPVEHLLQFSVALHNKGLAPSTIQGKLAAVGFYAKANGFRDFSGDFRIRKMLEGWAREKGKVEDDRTPISPVILERLGELWGVVCGDGYEKVLFHAAALVAFFGAMRISELVALGKGDVSRNALQFDDVMVQGEQVVVRIRSSKADQTGRGCHLRMGRCSRESICPVKAVKEFISFRGTGQGYFFQHADKSPLTKYQFWRLTDMALERLGVKHMRFGTHSFRIGAASTAAALGYSVEQIKQIGHWSSKCYHKYVRQIPNTQVGADFVLQVDGGKKSGGTS
uniref:Integrase/recombinase xerD homolog n=1 Tax=Pogona vitticeps TaxID=103695 RepID=A0ABM5GDC1_9SAUR